MKNWHKHLGIFFLSGLFLGSPALFGEAENRDSGSITNVTTASGEGLHEDTWRIINKYKIEIEEEDVKERTGSKVQGESLSGKKAYEKSRKNKQFRDAFKELSKVHSKTKRELKRSRAESKRLNEKAKKQDKEIDILIKGQQVIKEDYERSIRDCKAAKKLSEDRLKDIERLKKEGEKYRKTITKLSLEINTKNDQLKALQRKSGKKSAQRNIPQKNVVKKKGEKPAGKAANVEDNAGYLPEKKGQPEKPAIPRNRSSYGIVLLPGQVLNITIKTLGLVELDMRERRISHTGEIYLDFLGNTQVKGLSLEGLREKLKLLYGDLYRNLDVDITFVKQEGGVSPWGYVTVLGRVKNPGQVPMPASQMMTVSMAIQAAGGFDTSANLKKITVSREGDERKIEVTKVDLRPKNKTVRGRDVLLKPNDLINVPEKFW